MANKYRSVLASGGGVQPTGNAQPADVLSGKTFSNADGIDKTGTMPNNGAVSQTLSGGQSYTIPAGYHNGSGVVNCDAPVLTDATIKFGVTYHDGGSGASGQFVMPNVGYKHATLTVGANISLNGTAMSLNTPVDISSVTTLTFGESGVPQGYRSPAEVLLSIT